MEQFIDWNIRAALYWLMFALAYGLLLRRNVQPAFNRFYLLVSVFVSMLLPLIPASWLTVAGAGNTAAVVQLPEIIIRAGQQMSDGNLYVKSAVETAPFFTHSVLIVSAFTALMLLLRLGYLGRMIVLNKRSKINGMVWVQLKDNKAPFSFFHWIFASEDLQHDERFTQIMAHEKAHASRMHSLDVLFFEVLQLLFWYHPVFYFYRNEIKAMHEFEADAIALSQTSKSVYQKVLLDLSLGGEILLLTNPFNVSLIKKRMLMMNQKQGAQPTRKWLKVITIVPFILIAVMIQSCDFSAKEEQQVAVQQEVPAETPQLADQLPAEVTQDDVFTVVEVMPVYPGGQEAMVKYLSENIHYPQVAKRDTIQGRVFVNFIVEKDGSVSHVKVLRGIGGGCDEEAVRVVAGMPAWSPGTQRGEAVRVSFTLPIRFALN